MQLTMRCSSPASAHVLMTQAWFQITMLNHKARHILGLRSDTTLVLAPASNSARCISLNIKSLQMQGQGLFPGDMAKAVCMQAPAAGCCRVTSLAVVSAASGPGLCTALYLNHKPDDSTQLVGSSWLPQTLACYNAMAAASC